MASFNESFHMVFLGTKATTANANQVKGFIINAGIPTSSLKTNTGVAATDYGIGSWGLFDSNYNSVSAASIAGSCCSLMLASASVMTNDKIGPFAGGYKESVKSKWINPKTINSFVRVDPCTPRQQVVHVGSTKYTKTLSPSNGACNFEFVCNETYNLQIILKGSPALRFLNHDIIRLIEFNSGCCPSDEPLSVVDGTLAMIAWANAIIADPLLQNYISPIVYSEAGVALYAPGTVGFPTWDNYVSPGHVPGTYAGLRLLGAYVDTVFGNCSFETLDFFEKEPVQIFASMVDFNGDPCAFTGICVVTECSSLMGNGFGETAVRDLIMSERYRQNKFASASQERIREIEQGTDILNSITRSSLYTRYIIQHNIPRNNNPNGLQDRDQYTLEIICNGANANFEATMTAWLASCGGSCQSLQVVSCGTCTPLTP